MGKRVSRLDNELEKVIRFLDARSFYKGRSYPYHYLDYLGEHEEGQKRIFDFEVESDQMYRFFKVSVETFNHEIVKTSCDCNEQRDTKVCRHAAACIIFYREEIFSMTEDEKKLYVGENLLKEFYKDTSEKQIKLKKQLNMKIEFVFRYNETEVELKFKIGDQKLYSLHNKINPFMEVYEKNYGSVVFGKDFTYDPTMYYFSSEDEEIIRFIKRLNIRNYVYDKNIILDSTDVENFLELIKGKDFSIGNKLITSVVKDNPFKIEIKQQDKFYSLLLDEKNSARFLTRDCKFAIDGQTLFIIPNDPAKVFSAMSNNEISNFLISEENIDKFSKSVLPVFKENVNVDEKLHDKIVIGGKPVPKIYFDLKGNIILCNLKFDYRKEEVNYFDKDYKVVRDVEFEQSILGLLLGLGFEVNNNKIYMDNMETIGNFLDKDLEELALKYEVFTSNKIKETSIVKNSTIRSKFSIGADNIMHYEFDLGEIKNDEIVNILSNIKSKKKYYRLKSGDFLNLEDNDSLKQLESLVDDMDLKNSDLVNGTGIIPKYRAIYLDSVKKDKYNIIETNNLFDELIDKFNSYKDIKVKFSKADKNILRDYQEVGVKWLYNIYKCGFGGILADEMGLGKSIQLIYLIKEVLKEKPDAKVLIVAPTALIYNWKNEFDKFGQGLKYKVFAENKTVRKHELENTDNINVLITTYGLVRRDRELYEEKTFEIVALDEAQNIKNNNAQMTKAVKSLRANTKFALTGTPLENSVLELWSIFDFIMPGYLANLLSFNRKYNIKDVDEENIKALENLNNQIKPFILRRKKKDVVKELPDKLENNIFIDLNPEQKKIYVAELKNTQKELDEILATEGFKKGNFKILQLLLKLRELCIDPSMVYENYKGGSSKIENLVNLVKDIISNGHKILLFTSFKMALDIVNREFTNNNISTYVIDGSVPAKRRVELVDKFNEDDTNVFLITLKSGGTGLNLTSADVVIHLDLWWNPQVENQATDRAHRIGQTKTVEVIKLICNGTIEEKILELQNKKKLLSDTLIEGEDRDRNIISELSVEDVKKLLSIDNNEE